MTTPSSTAAAWVRAAVAAGSPWEAGWAAPSCCCSRDCSSARTASMRSLAAIRTTPRARNRWTPGSRTAAERARTPTGTPSAAWWPRSSPWTSSGEGTSPRLRAGSTRCRRWNCSAGPIPRPAARRPPRPARSTARRTPRSTWTPASSTRCAASSARTPTPWPRSTSWRTRWGTTCRTCRAPWAGRSRTRTARRRPPCAPSCRPTAMRGCGRITRPSPAGPSSWNRSRACSSPTRSRRPGRSATTGSRRPPRVARTRSPSPTAPRRSARRGSSPATRPGTSARATRSPPRT